MGAALRGVVGLVAAGGWFAASQTCSGCVASASLLLSIFTGVVALGLVTAAIVDQQELRTLRSGPVLRFTGHCHLCGRTMLQTGPVWICAKCDRGRRHFFVARHRP